MFNALKNTGALPPSPPSCKQDKSCFPTTFIGICFLLTLGSLIAIGGYSERLNYAVKTYLTESFQVEDISDQIRSFDSSLTYAATMYALTGDEQWRASYDTEAQGLDKAIADLRTHYPDKEDGHDSAQAIDDANKKLVEMELRAFALSEDNKGEDARDILSSREYLEQKQAYSKGLDEFYEEVERTLHKNMEQLAAFLHSSFYIAILTALLLSGVWLAALMSLGEWRRDIEDVRNSLADRIAEKDKLEHQMSTYIDEVRAAHERAMQAADIAEHANYAKSEFLANMSHELRTPMNGIIGMADMLENTRLDTEQQEYIDVLRNSAKSLLLIVNDILDLSKIEAGSMELESEPFDIGKAVTDTAELFLSVASKRGIVLSAHIAENVPRFVEGDNGRFIQIMRNLISNALKFTDQGSVHVNALMEGPQLFVSVHDTGIGIPEEQLGTIFEKFHQANNTSTRKYGGTGLGLAICKQLTEMMGGQIGVESTLNKGSTFWFKIPLKVRTDIESIIDRINARNDVPQLKTNAGTLSVDKDFSLLLAEDHPTNQLLMKRLLSKLGFQKIDIAENGKQALELFEKNRYDLILMDCQMPEMDGYETTGWIRKLENGETHVPVIAMTANAMLGDRDRCLESGMDDYISKPIDAQKFTQTLMRWLPGQTSEGSPSGSAAAKSAPPQNHAPEQQNAPVNVSHLEMFTEGDKDMERELFGIFSEQALLTLERMEHCCGDNETQEWKSAAHKLKGAAANLGAEKLSALCFDAESGYGEPYDKKQVILSSIRKGFEEVQNFLDQRIAA